MKKQKETTYTSQSLVPYSKVVNENTISTFPLQGNKKSFIQAVRVEGFDLFNLKTSEQDIKLHALKQLFMNLDTKVTLVKIEEPLDMSNNKDFLKSQLEHINSKISLTKPQKRSRMHQLEDSIDLFSEENILNDNNPQKAFYFVTYNSKMNELIADINEIDEKCQSAGLKTRIIDYVELVNLIKNIYEVSSFKFTKEDIDKYKDNLDKILALNEIEFFGKFTKIGSGNYTNYGVVREYPIFPKRSWLYGLMNTDSTVIMHISNPKNSEFEKKLNNTILNLKANISGKSQKDQTGISKLQHELEVYEEVVNSVGTHDETFKNMNIYVITSANSKKELFAKLDEQNKYHKNDGIFIDPLAFHQYEGFASAMLKPFDLLHDKFSRETTATTLAESFPFISTSVKDERGMFIGINTLGEPIVLDQFKNLLKIYKERKNANAFIIGTTGSGKSTTAKVVLNNHIALGRKVYIIDPEREYKKLCEYHSGSWIDCGVGTSGRINPLQIMATFQDNDIEINNRTIVSQHLRFLESWFKVLYPEMSDKEIRHISKIMSMIYSTKKYQDGDFSKMKASSFPIFDDVIAFMEKLLKDYPKEFDTPTHLEILDLLKSDFGGYGKYRDLYNGFSSIKQSSNDLIVFDIYTLNESRHKPSIQAQMLLITSFIQNELKINSFETQDETVVLIDEAHLLIDHENPIALDFIFQLVKRIRKRRGGVILVTQNPADFVGTPEISKKTTAMLNNVQYSFIGNLSATDIEDVHNMYKAYGGLTESQSNFLAHAKIGDFLLLTGGFERQTMKVIPLNKIREVM